MSRRDALVLEGCTVFVPGDYAWRFIDGIAYVNGVKVTETQYRRAQVCHSCGKSRVHHEREIVEHYSTAGPFMTRPPVIEELPWAPRSE